MVGVDKSYDLGINYHPGKMNIVTDSLSQRSHLSKLVVEKMPFILYEEFDKIFIKVDLKTRTLGDQAKYY
jgi:hypothetical protein